MMSMAEIEMEEDDDTATQPLDRNHLPRFSLRTGVTYSNVEIEMEPMTQPLPRILPAERDEWSAWTSPTNKMVALPPRSETTVTRPMLRISQAPVEPKALPPVPQAPRAKLESGLRPLSRDGDERKSLPPVPHIPRIPRPPVQSDVPLPRPRPRLASVGLRPVKPDSGPRFERAPAMPTPLMFAAEPAPKPVAPKPVVSDDHVEIAPQFRVDPAPLATLPNASPPPARAPEPAPAATPSPPPFQISQTPSDVLGRVEASHHTKRTTLPPMQHAVGLPVVQGFQDFSRALPSFPAPPPVRPQPVPWFANLGANKVLSSPFFLLAFAVSLVAMSVLGFAAVASSASDSRRSARTRVITASDIGGAAITDATVFIDGSPNCTSLPCTVELAEGAHWVTVRAAGYDVPPSRAVRTGSSESTSVHFGLTRPTSVPLPVYGAPTVTTQPNPSAPTVATGTPAVVAPSSPAIVPVAPAPAALVAPAPALVAAPIAPAAAPAPTPVPVAAAPVSTEGTLNINSLPVSNIVLDGRPLGQTPKLRVKVKPGNHSVVFIRNGKRVDRGVRVNAGESVTVSVRL
jgi:hypothetical protein